MWTEIIGGNERAEVRISDEDSARTKNMKRRETERAKDICIR